ncbi:MAG: SDR family oxidoreductase [Shewanellaceae bacterium]|nr:SDR family oxidoreductase [Shewanellaceae bacterium]
MQKHILITGANRGLGLEFTKQYLAEASHVTATYRQSSTAVALHELQAQYPNSLSLVKLDITAETDCQQLGDMMRDQSIDVLINNAGIADADGHQFGELNTKNWQQVMLTNAIAPLLLTQTLIQPVVRAQGKIIFITSRMGSIADNNSGQRYSYRSSKAALNAAAKSLAVDLEADGIAVGILHPGWVQTDMGGSNAWITAEQSVAQMRERIEALNLGNTGHFLHADGTNLPW